MNTINIEEVEVKIPDTWDEVTLDQFLKFMKWLQNKPSEFKYSYEELEYSFELVKIFSNLDEETLNNFHISNLETLISNFTLFVNSVPTFDQKDFVVINGKLYSFAYLDKLSFAEYVSYSKILEVMKDQIDAVPYLLGIICRPATKTFNTEKKKDEYKLSPFKYEDVEFRAELFKTQPAIELMGAANFFLSGNKKPTLNLSDYIEVDQVQEEGI